MKSLLPFPKRGLDGRKRQHKRQGRVEQRYGTIARIPRGHPFILGIDEKNDATDLCCGQQTSPTRCQQKLSANPLSLKPAVHRQARQAESGNVMPRQPSTENRWCPSIVNGCRTQAIEAENGFLVGIVDGKEGFCPAQLVALPGISAQKFVQRLFAAVERISIVLLANWLFVPRHD